jgi:hypothetical protein
VDSPFLHKFERSPLGRVCTIFGARHSRHLASLCRRFSTQRRRSTILQISRHYHNGDKAASPIIGPNTQYERVPFCYLPASFLK